MHLCDKCVRFNKCYKRGTWPTQEQREAVMLAGCKDYKELTVKAMFMKKKGERNENNQRSKR